MTNQFNTQTILKAITNCSDKGNTLKNIKHYTYNSDPGITGTDQAIEALKDFNEHDKLYEKTNLNGIFGAIKYVQFYELYQFGKVYTNLGDPKKVANMVAFINREEIISDLAEKLSLGLDDELTEQQAKQLSSVETMQELLKK